MRAKKNVAPKTTAMLQAMTSRAAARARRFLRGRAGRRFARNQKAAAAVEFAFVAAPFFGLLFAILETGLVCFAQQTLETGMAEAARLIMTGQAQSDPDFTEAKFKKTICDQTFLYNCEELINVSVQTYSNFGATSGSQAAPPMKDGNVDSDKLPFAMGGPGSIVVAQAYYQWPIAVPLLDDLANLNGNQRLLVATSVFRNEPYN
ncbi:MAG TPA: TadE/TadG family type IV pilus assembly protein [Pseudolabrys sp.]|nr:TadE/TadG family type IV pilus assembly protein [Pseudolabrys sp.]